MYSRCCSNSRWKGSLSLDGLNAGWKVLIRWQNGSLKDAYAKAEMKNYAKHVTKKLKQEDLINDDDDQVIDDKHLIRHPPAVSSDLIKRTSRKRKKPSTVKEVFLDSSSDGEKEAPAAAAASSSSSRAEIVTPFQLQNPMSGETTTMPVGPFDFELSPTLKVAKKNQDG